jgi:deazaflavin-dependent oxidoreductase (nitroreductase family)
MTERIIPKPDFMEEVEWNNLIAVRDPAVIRAVAKHHVQQYLEAKGEGDTYLTQGAPTLLITSIGRKTGNEIVSPANFVAKGDAVYVVGSLGGLDIHPHWALNLDATAKAWVQVKADRWAANVERLLGDEREAEWPFLTENFPLWGHFQKYCDREFMVFRLTPKKD